MNKRFARIIESSDGRQVLFYVEPDGGDFLLHQVANHEFFQVDVKIEFTSKDEDENKRCAYIALDAVDQVSADKVVSLISEMMGEEA